MSEHFDFVVFIIPKDIKNDSEDEINKMDIKLKEHAEYHATTNTSHLLFARSKGHMDSLHLKCGTKYAIVRHKICASAIQMSAKTPSRKMDLPNTRHSVKKIAKQYHSNKSTH